MTMRYTHIAKSLAEILDPQRFSKEPAIAVKDARVASEFCRDLPEFNTTVDGEEMRFFEDRAFLRIEKVSRYRPGRRFPASLG